MGEKAVYLPPSFHKTLEVFSPGDNPDIDVLFYGVHNDRRGKIIGDLQAHGLHVVHLFDVYGDELIQFIRRAKIVLNIHAQDAMDTLETVRLSFLVANRCFVISETSDHDPYGAGVVYADYEALVPACIEYLGPRASRRAVIANAGYVAYRRSDFHSELRDALLHVPLKDLIVTPTAGSGSATNRPLRDRSSRPVIVPPALDPYFKRDHVGSAHTGVPYLEFLNLMATHLKPRSYLEIGTESGTSLKQFECDALCIDPAFQITQNVLMGRKRTFFFQMTSDEFFAEYDPKVFFPRGVDMALLDGLHHFDALLKDFINFERCSNEDSVAILHNCLPTDLTMTSRQFQPAGWTGDVWQILPALKRYRPDLRILLLDCPPTGLVVCCGLNAKSNVLHTHFEEIVKEHSRLVLDNKGLQELRSIFPLVDTYSLVENGGDMRLLLASASARMH